MNILEIDGYKEKYHEYLSILAKDYIQGGKLDNTISIYTNEIRDIVGTEQNVFYTNEDFEPAVEMLSKFLHRKAKSVIGQLDGTIPSDRDGQEKAGDRLIDTSDIDVTIMGSYSVRSNDDLDNVTE